MKRAIITGATGVAGTALIKELIRNDIELLVLVKGGKYTREKVTIATLVARHCV